MEQAYNFLQGLLGYLEANLDRLFVGGYIDPGPGYGLDVPKVQRLP
jgi:hypothetical protein